MTLSSTSPVMLPGGPDPLYEAWEALRLARQVAWNAQSPGGWRAGFHQQIARAWSLVSAHVEQAAGFEATRARRAMDDAALSRQEEDHEALLAQLRELAGVVTEAIPADIHTLVECTERAAMIEIRVAMHQNRLHELLERSGTRGPRREDSRVPELARRS